MIINIIHNHVGVSQLYLPSNKAATKPTNPPIITSLSIRKSSK